MKKTSLGEMIANAISHGIGFLLAVTGLILLLIKADTTQEILSSLVFGLSMMILYISSTLFHSFPEKMKRTYTVFQRLDHSSIFLLISGTYTPFLVLVVNNTKGYILLAVLWVLTILGIVFKSIWIDKFKMIHLAIYLIMGWSVMLVKGDFFSNLDNYTYVLLGGISYTVGVAFYVSRFKYSHFVWHIFVLGGTFFHFLAIYNIL
ncbi:MAG: hemolysin III family protein [Sphaerochaetaceae bacterium]|nr:hemolysin III family protein [Sphaerochaetaceae bacterium]